MSTIAIIGRSGQVAQALARGAAGRSFHVVCAGRPEADLADARSLGAFLNAAKPDLIVNAAAYTAVDKAETERDLAFTINAHGPAVLAKLVAEAGIPLVHISTDYVFDGTSRRPYREDDPIAPLGVYGASKAAGEAAVREVLPRHIILRTSWVFGADGTNFLKTMLRLGQTRDEIGVVADQHGGPTFAGDLADAILDLVPRLVAGGADVPWGTYHVTNAGETTWHGFAAEIFALAAREGLKTPRLEAIATADYPTPARRPAYSVLDCGKIERTFGLRRRHWREGLEACITKLARDAREGGAS